MGFSTRRPICRVMLVSVVERISMLVALGAKSGTFGRAV